MGRTWFIFLSEISTTGTCGIASVYTLSDDGVVRDICRDNYPDNLQECVLYGPIIRWRSLKSFSVSAIQSCPVIYAFSHELGHNMGLFHDRFTVREKAKQDIMSSCEEQFPDRVDSCFQQNYPSRLEDFFSHPYKPYAFGYVNQNFNRPICWRTIMAYDDQCEIKDFLMTYGVGRNISKALYFSNPSRRANRL